MVVKTFSEESVKFADAANTLGFDVVERYEKPVLGGGKFVSAVRLSNTRSSLEVNSNWFPEIGSGEKISLLYIIHFEDCNRLYRSCGMYQSVNV